jgi:hypothetical protein
MASVARVCFVALLCAVVPLLGCGDSPAAGGISLDTVKEFHDYPVYYAGGEVAGHPLESIDEEDAWGRNGKTGRTGFTFYYGDCDPPDGLFAEGGCAPPVQIQNYSICDRNLGMYRGKQKVRDVRGAKGATNGGGLEIFTGRTTVVIFAIDEPSLVGPAIRRLRRVGKDAPPSRLPPPVPGGVWGKLPC